jgi:hypothetical protein
VRCQGDLARWRAYFFRHSCDQTGISVGMGI